MTLSAPSLQGAAAALLALAAPSASHGQRASGEAVLEVSATVVAPLPVPAVTVIAPDQPTRSTGTLALRVDGAFAAWVEYAATAGDARLVLHDPDGGSHELRAGDRVQVAAPPGTYRSGARDLFLRLERPATPGRDGVASDAAAPVHARWTLARVDQ